MSEGSRAIMHKASKNRELAPRGKKRKDNRQALYFPPPGNPARQLWVDWVVEPGATETYQLPEELEKKIQRLTRSKRILNEQASDKFRKSTPSSSEITPPTSVI
ncbi:MAG: hypothetical protein Q8P67_11215 [archaeon]|nr:hypothetical protein [archaeon]